MGIQYEGDSMEEILRLARDNNRMLHAMRRSSFFSAVFRVILWVAFIVVPLWLYVQYLMPVMNGMMQTYQQIQGTNAAAQAQFGQMSESLQKLQGLFGGKQ